MTSHLNHGASFVFPSILAMMRLSSELTLQLKR